MANLRYGMKEVANVIFFDIDPNSETYKKPVAFLDTLKVSSIENESETAEARGGRGNNKLMTWDYGRTANLSISDALLSDTTIAMLAGSQMKSENIRVVGREQFGKEDDVKKLTESGTTGAYTYTFTLDETPTAGTLTVYNYKDGLIVDEIVIDSADIVGSVVTFDSAVLVNDVMAFYEYVIATGANQIVFSGEKFPSTYRVVGETLVRGEDGVDRRMQFEIPKAKMQSTFSLTMDVENVATFDFTLEVLMDAKSREKELYTITRLND